MNLKEYNHFFKIEKKIEKDLWSKAIFVFDTSSILEMYYYSEEARKEIFQKTIHLLKKNLWITGHTNFEYLKNRQSVIYKAFSEKYNRLKNEDIPNFRKEIESLYNRLDAIKKATKRVDIHPFINQEIFSSVDLLIESLKNEFESFNGDFLKEVSLRETEIKKLEKDDEIYSLITQYFQITEDYEYSKLEELVSNGKLRYEHNIPPGFRDGNGKARKKEYRGLEI